MRNPSVAVASSFVVGLVSGCVSHMPQTAAEFRSAVQGGAFMTRVTSFEANRPYQQVADAFQAKAPCFSVRVETESTTRTSYQYIVAAYKPTVTIGPAHAELDVQE